MGWKRWRQQIFGGAGVWRRAGLSFATVIVVSLGLAPAAGAFVYWANVGGDTIGRAELDGGSPTQTFITGADLPCGVAVNGAYIYWANSGTQSIGRANIDGSSPNPNFIPNAGAACGVAVDGGHIYWGICTDPGGSIGR